MVDIDKLTRETISKGGILALLYFDIHGNTPEIITNLGAGFVDRIIKEKGVVTAFGEIDEPIQNNGIYSTSVQIKVLTESFQTLFRLCVTYSPFSVEILRPEEMRFGIDKMQELLMFASATTMDYKKYIIQNISKPEDVQTYKKFLENKAQLGKKLLENKK